jgi:hypothetical protein
MPLYEINVEGAFYVEADDEQDAQLDAEHACLCHSEDFGLEIVAVDEVKTLREVEKTWHRLRPLGNEHQTIEEIFAAADAEKRPTPLPGQRGLPGSGQDVPVAGAR